MERILKHVAVDFKKPILWGKFVGKLCRIAETRLEIKLREAELQNIVSVQTDS